MHRHERFSAEYVEKLEYLTHVLLSYILSKYKEMPLETKELNKSLAIFLKVSAYFYYNTDILVTFSCIYNLQ